ncbi:hypothetical protein Strain138_001074 [Pseudogemmatithrix spongiicola]|uniref:Uncharacterized protein n=1 Tax=Pseudogemmatithrix spongiicola TaxID=3062599 RepID=A0AA49JUD2_9BACT|nr:hypothetical protein Strain138_001074 [Gemmatimonadaceae bacterium 'strain 138']WKW14718.1 hypothetical protein Strain318_001074 [Gemmatimonadaceae bacterium 'strain 318']
MQEIAQLYREEDADEQLLRIFGVDSQPFLNAVASGWLQWANRSEFDAPSFPGSLLWGHTVRAERTQLSERRWTCDSTDNFPTCITPDGKMAIVVETGDEETGKVVPGRRPRTKSQKGPRTMQMVRDNSQLLQGDLFSAFAMRPRLVGEGPLLWVHLIHQHGGFVYHEISLPTVADSDSRITGWKCRIILPTYRSGSALSKLTAPTPAPDIQVQVKRRAG